MNWSRKPLRGSAASSDAAYSSDAASGGNTGLGALVTVILAIMERVCDRGTMMTKRTQNQAKLIEE